MSVTLPPPSAGLASAILGFWQLVSREDFDAAGHRNIDPVLGADPLGVLCFAPGRFAAQFSRRDRSALGGDLRRGRAGRQQQRGGQRLRRVFRDVQAERRRGAPDRHH